MATDPQPSRKSLERLDNEKPRFQGCSRIQEYEYICKLGEGTFGEVSKAKSKRTGQIVALKKILMHNEKDGFPITALREIKLLKQLDHINVLKLEEMAVERPKNASKKTSMFMVTPYMDHDLSGLLENPNVHFTEPQIKCYMKQLLEGCAYLHENRILHRDMKAANLLINNKGILQIADFGLARPYDDEPPKPGQGGGEATRDYTTLVVTRWYRPPELLLQLRRYTTAIDLWGVGCVFGEMFKGKPILAGNSDMHQAQMIFDLVGSPNDQTMPGWSQLPGPDGSPSFIFEQRTSTLRYVFKDQSDLAISLLTELLKLDWRKRINAIDALEHPYFHTPPLPARPGDLPSFEESHELDRRKLRDQKNKPPPAPAGGSVGVGAQGEWGVNGQPIPHDTRGGGRGRPYANGHGPPHGRRPPHYGHRDAPHGQYRHPPRDLPPRDQMPVEQSRVPPISHPLHDPYSRRPLPPPPDTSLPPRPPPPEVDSYRERFDQGMGSAPGYRDDRRGPPARSRVPPGADLDRRVPPELDRRPPPDMDRRPPPDRGGARDTFIPDYSHADPNERIPPHGRRERDYRREDLDRPRYPESRRNSRDFSEPIRYDDRPPPPFLERRRGSRDYEEPLRYDDHPPIRRPSREYDDPAPMRYEDRGRPPSRDRPITPMGAGYDRRRSRSPVRDRDWERERGRDRGYGRQDIDPYRR